MSATTKPEFRATLRDELTKFLVVFSYLGLFFSAFTAYGLILLAEYHLSYFHLGYNLVEAFVLAKVILLGSMFGLGERFRSYPLIVPTLYKTACFSLLLLAFSVLEHLLTGWLWGKPIGAVVSQLLDQGPWEILARVLVKCFALVPLFAAWELARVLGEGKLFELFLGRHKRDRVDGISSSSSA